MIHKNIFLVPFTLFLSLVFFSCSPSKEMSLTDVDFIELFHALEIEGIDSLRIELPIFREFDPVQYGDYIVQKYKLWDNNRLVELIQAYKDKKKVLYVRENYWHQTLLSAQNFSINGFWKKELHQFEQNNQDEMLTFLKKAYPDLFTVIQSFIDRDISIAEKLYPQFQISTSEVKSLFQNNSEEIQRRVQIMLRVFSRQLFKEAFQKMNVNI